MHHLRVNAIFVLSFRIEAISHEPAPTGDDKTRKQGAVAFRVEVLPMELGDGAGKLLFKVGTKISTSILTQLQAFTSIHTLAPRNLAVARPDDHTASLKRIIPRHEYCEEYNAGP